MTNWTHRFELKIPSSKNFYHYEYLYIPVEENNKYNGSKIKNDPFNVMAMFMGLPRDEFNAIYPKYDFNVFKLGILKTIADTPATLIYHDDFFVPEGDNGEYVQDTLGMSSIFERGFGFFSNSRSTSFIPYHTVSFSNLLLCKRWP